MWWKNRNDAQKFDSLKELDIWLKAPATGKIYKILEIDRAANTVKIEWK